MLILRQKLLVNQELRWKIEYITITAVLNVKLKQTALSLNGLHLNHEINYGNVKVLYEQLHNHKIFVTQFIVLNIIKVWFLERNV